jgi:hypothetical protein
LRPTDHTKLVSIGLTRENCPARQEIGVDTIVAKLSHDDEGQMTGPYLSTPPPRDRFQDAAVRKACWYQRVKEAGIGASCPPSREFPGVLRSKVQLASTVEKSALLHQSYRQLEPNVV